MADFQAGLWQWMTSEPTITAQVGTRIFPVLAPATAPLPFVTYQRIGEYEEAHLTGLSGLSRAVYQFDVWGQTADSAESALQALKAAMDMYRGLMGVVPIRQFSITSILDGLEAPSEGQTMGLFRHTITADVWFHEPVGV